MQSEKMTASILQDIKTDLFCLTFFSVFYSIMSLFITEIIAILNVILTYFVSRGLFAPEMSRNALMWKF